MKRVISIFLAIILIVSCLTACSTTKQNEVTSTPQEQPGTTDPTVESTGKDEVSVTETETNVSRVVTDMMGNQVEFSSEVNRVCVDWASGITLVMTLGATDKLVGKYQAFEEDSFAWARVICPSIMDVPTENEILTSQNEESILTLEPDLVVTSTKENVELYTNLGMKAIYVKFNDYESFKESLLIVGEAMGESELAKAMEYNSLLDSNIALVQERTASVPDEEKPSVYYMDSRFNDAYHTVGTGEIQESWIVSAGGILATDGHFEGRNIEITAEKFLEIDPDIIVIGAQNQAEVYDMLMNDPILCELSAVKNNEVYRLPQGIFPWCRTGPEAAIHVIWAGQFLYPELFEDYNMYDVAREFYKEFYGSEISDEYIGEILAGHLVPGGK